MDPVVIEEIESDDVPEEELSEFVVSDVPMEISVQEPTCSKFVFNQKKLGASPNVFIGDHSSSEEIDEETEDYGIMTDATVPKLENLRLSDKEESMWLKKLINNEVSYGEYTSKMGRTEDVFEDLDENDDSNQEYPVPKNIPKMKYQQQHEKSIMKGKNFLPVALQGLMGQANLCYARGEVAMAEKLCLEIIRQMPLAAEPYLTLSQIYESSDPEKHMQFLVISAHLNPSEDQWVRIAEMSLERGDKKQAIGSYTKAIKCDPKNIDLRMKRIALLKSIGEDKHALRCYFLMLPFISKDQHEFLIQTAKFVAQKFHEDNHFQNALEAMLRAYTKVPSFFETEDINLLLELMIANGQYRKALNVLTLHTSIEINVVKDLSEDNLEIELDNLYIPDDLILDFRTKLVVTLIHLRATNLVPMLINNVLEFVDIEDAGDCLLDIAEALMKEKQFQVALRLLNPLVNSQNYSLAAVWLRHADCNRSVENYEEAIKSYKIVVQMAQHLDARLTLSALLKKQGRIEESLEALTQNADVEVLDPELLYEKCLLLKELENVNDYLENGYLLLLRHCVYFRSRAELQVVCSFVKMNDRVNELKNMRKTREEPVEDADAPEFGKSSNEPSVEEEWQLYQDLITVAYNNKRFPMLQKLAFTAMASKKFQHNIREIDFIGLLACIYNREEFYGYNKIKDFVNSDMKFPRLWNLYNLVIYITQDCRYYRYLMRCFERTANLNPMVYMLVGNYCLMSNSYKYALNHYSMLNKKVNSPLITLLLSIIYTQIASQKYSNRKQQLVVQSIAYMENYRKMREPEALQEVFYNTGRLYHQVGMLPMAKWNYEQALEVKNSLIDKYPQYLCLRREIAFNLHLIYKSSGNRVMARKYLYDYIEV